MERSYCKWCGQLLPIQSGRGRHASYCPPPRGCKYSAYRYRKDDGFRGILPRNKPYLDLIFCAGDNREFFQVAYEAGFLLGIRSGRQSYGYKVQFVDIEYRRRDFEKHLKVVARHQPKYATVLDLTDDVSLTFDEIRQDVDRAMRQYEQLSPYCQIPLIVPKLPGQIALLPDHVAIGYSVLTSYGGARYKLGELEGRRVHILGGSPHQQMEIYKLLADRAEVMSVDGNMAMKIAREYSEYWQHGQWVKHPEKGTEDVPLYLDCWRRSCENIRREWERLAILQPRQLTLV